MRKHSSDKAGKRNYEIAVIGARGSGKTTLAAGLYASSRDDFTVGTDDNTSEAYLNKLKSKLQDGHWPESTLIDERPNIKLRINEGPEHVTSISFEDYMGELFSTDVNFIEDHVKTPDGAILLFNPGMDLLSDTEERNKVFSLFRKIIDHLHKCGCRHVAFVVTAADRLDGDLKDKKDVLGGYEKEITNYLKTVGGSKWWSRIPVTVTGPLESQAMPTLANGDANTAKLPFVYLLDQLKKDEQRRRSRNVFMRLCLVAFVTALAIAGVTIYKYFSERNKILELKQAMNEFEPKSSSELGKAKELRDDLENKYDKLNELTTWFNANRRIWAATTNEWTSLKEVRTYTYLCCAIDDLLCNAATNGTDANISLMEDSVNGFHPVNNQQLSKGLRKKWAENKQNIQRIHDGERHRQLKDAIAKAKDLAAWIVVQNKAKEWKPVKDNEQKKCSLLTEIDKSCCKCAEAEWMAFETGSFTNATEAAVSGFAGNLRDWLPVSKETTAVKSNRLARLPDMAVKWCTEYKIDKISKLCEKNGFTVNDGLGPLKDSLLVPMTNGCSEEVYATNSKKLSGARKRLLDAIIKAYAQKVWNSNSDDLSPDEWCSASWIDFDKSKRFEDCIMQEERCDAESTLKSVRQSNKERWHEIQMKHAEKFIMEISGKTAVDACVLYGNFCSEHPRNPGLNPTNGNVRAAFHEKVKAAFSGYKTYYDAEFRGPNRIYATSGDRSTRVENAEKKYSEFSNLCQLLPSNAANTLGDTKEFQFAKEAAPELQKGQYGAFMQNLLIKKSELSFTSTNIRTSGWWTGFKVTIYYDRYCGQGIDKEEILLPVRHYDKKTVNGKGWENWLNGNYSISFNAWMEPGLAIKLEDCCGGENGETCMWFNLKEFANDSHTFETPVSFVFDNGKKIDSTVFSVRVYGELTGGGFLDLWRKHFGE